MSRRLGDDKGQGLPLSTAHIMIHSSRKVQDCHLELTEISMIDTSRLLYTFLLGMKTCIHGCILVQPYLIYRPSGIQTKNSSTLLWP